MMTDSDESTVMMGRKVGLTTLKSSMQRMREERNKYREMYDRSVRDLKEEKRNRKAVHCSYIVCIPVYFAYFSILNLSAIDKIVQ